MESIFEEIYSESEGIRNYNTLIDGCWNCLSGDRTFDVLNPADGSVIAKVPNCEVPDVEKAVTASRQYFNGPGISPVERLEVMERARELLIENSDQMAELITLESGKPISVSRGEVKATAERLKLTLQEVRVLYGEYIPGEWVEDTQNKFAIVMRKPLGTVLAISSFNYPLYIAAAKIIPAILAGNSVIAKPSSETPLALLHFVGILEKAGLPPGAINTVTGRGGEIGDFLIEHEDIAAITFTGSTAIGKHIASKSGLKKIHLELGGNAAAIVLADADIDNAVKHIAKGTFRNSGQRCDAVSRVLIEEPVKKEFIEKFLIEMGNYRTGDPMDDETGVGPVINSSAIKRIERLVEDAVSRGAEIVSGGTGKDLFYEPTVLDNVTLNMDIAWEEIFGPVLPVITVKDQEEAVEISNRSDFGLDSCLFTENIRSAFKISKMLEDGTVTINGAPAHGVGHFPFGGNKDSGIGREGLKYSIDELTKLHTIIVNE